MPWRQVFEPAAAVDMLFLYDGRGPLMPNSASYGVMAAAARESSAGIGENRDGPMRQFGEVQAMGSGLGRSCRETGPEIDGQPQNVGS